jgi:hypothetical protein
LGLAALPVAGSGMAGVSKPEGVTMDSKLEQNVKTMDKAQGQSMDSAAPYKKLALVITINGVIMFLLTYALIDSFDHFYANINRVYMAVMMVAPMVVLMLLVMGSMYKNKKLNYALIAAFALIGLLAFALGRTQMPVGNEQFLRSMIPHHSSAILMCQESSIDDQEIIDLCGDIVDAQEREIAQMKDILARLD